MEKRMVTIFERAMTTTVNDIEHIESQSFTGVSVVRVYFQPNAKVELALSQITHRADSAAHSSPGHHSARHHQVRCVGGPHPAIGPAKQDPREQELFDLGKNFIRTQLATIQGAAVPLPYGGKFRSVMVDINPDQLFARQPSPADVSTALANQNLILPAGTAKIGDRDYLIKLNSSPRLLDEMDNIPVKVVNGATVYLKDVAQVRDGNTVQTSIVRVNGTRGALLTVMRNGKASTLAIVDSVKRTLPRSWRG